MKKKIYFLIMLIAATTMLSVSSCSKDDDEKENENSLVGTTWAAAMEDGAVGAVLSFLDESNCTMSLIEYGSYDGTYSYAPPDIVITLDVNDKSGIYNIMSGTVSGDTMTLSTPGGSVTFEKR